MCVRTGALTISQWPPEESIINGDCCPKHNIDSSHMPSLSIVANGSGEGSIQKQNKIINERTKKAQYNKQNKMSSIWKKTQSALLLSTSSIRL
jgi:hypothetical protein